MLRTCSAAGSELIEGQHPLPRPIAAPKRDGDAGGRGRFSLDRLGLGRRLDGDKGLHALLHQRSLIRAAPSRGGCKSRSFVRCSGRGRLGRHMCGRSLALPASETLLSIKPNALRRGGRRDRRGCCGSTAEHVAAIAASVPAIC
jgi:hypothetical protein